MKSLEVLTQEYAEFFDIPPKILSDDVKISYSRRLIGRIHLPSKTITLPFYNRIGFLRNFILNHEYRHIVHRNIIGHVVRENPDLYASYLHDIVDFQKLEHETKNPDLKKTIEQVSVLNPYDFEQHTDVISLFAALFNFYKRPDLFESFAANSRATEIAYVMAISMASLQTAQYFYLLRDNLDMYTDGTTKLFLNAAVATAFLVNTRYIVKDNETFTLSYLSEFPTEHRKYLLAIVPDRNVTFSEHLNKLRQYGFPVL